MCVCIEDCTKAVKERENKRLFSLCFNEFPKGLSFYLAKYSFFSHLSFLRSHIEFNSERITEFMCLCACFALRIV